MDIRGDGTIIISFFREPFVYRSPYVKLRFILCSLFMSFILYKNEGDKSLPIT